MSGERIKSGRILFEGFSILSLLVVLFLIVFTSLTTVAPLLLVVVGFLPTIVTIILGIIIYEESTHTTVIIWFIPFVLAGAFFLIGTGQSFLNSNLDVATLTALNIVLSARYLGFFFVFVRLITKEKKSVPHRAVQQKIVQKIVEKPVYVQAPQTIKDYIHSIEDKSKALNFVIGRVYNKYHGGSKEMREKISLKPEWYNEFSDALENNKKPDRRKLLSILSQIEARIKSLEMTESEVFGFTDSHSLKNLERNPDGNSKIIDVLKENDKDPVETYYKGTSEFCSKLRTELQK